MSVTIEDLLLEMFDEGEFSSISFFRGAKGGFQCNVNHRKTGTYGIGESESAIMAMVKGLKAAEKSRANVQKTIDGEHLKKFEKKKPNLDDLL